MKVFFFNRFFHPDTSATSQIVSDLAFHLAASGYEVHAVTSRSAPGLPEREEVRGVTVHRIAPASTGPHSLFARAIAYMRYYRGARAAARVLLVPGDVAVVKTDPPMLSAAIGPIAKKRGAKVIVWLQDVFPEIAREYGVPGMGKTLGSTIFALRNRSLASADAVVAIGERMAQHVASAVHAPALLAVIHNWADGVAIQPIAPERNTLRAAWGLRDAFVVGYSGNLGRVHEFETLLGAAASLLADDRVRFLIVGRGPRLAEVQAEVRRRKLANVIFQPHQDRHALAESLGAADVHLSVLQPRFEGLVHPSKLYGIMAAGRPTIFIGDPGGETALILSETASGTTVASGDAAGLAGAIVRLRDDREARERMGVAARRAFDERYSMPIAFGKWRELLEQVAG